MSDNKVLATVNGKDITNQDVYNFLNHLDPQIAAQFHSPQGLNQIAEELVNQELLYLNAVENKLDQEEGFQKELEILKENFLKQYAINKVLQNIEISEAEINQYYDENKEHFQVPESARASHILVDSEEEAKEIIEEMNNGLSFEEAAEKYSNCPSKAQGGDLGEFTRGRMVPEFETAAFSMEEGEISQPIQTQFGYHIIKLAYKKDPSISPIEEVKNQIHQQLTMTKQQERYLSETNKLKEKYEVKTYF